MRFTGTLDSWDDERGFGFILPDHDGDRIFVHIKAFRPGQSRPQAGQAGLRLSFEVGAGAQGKKRALRVEHIRAARRKAVTPAGAAAARGMAGSYAAILLLGILFLGSAMLWRVPRWALVWYLVASVITYGVYARDKSAAAARAWRIPEQTLLLLGLAGGWPGAIVAQQRLRHKSAKQPFRRAFWVTVLVNAALFVVLNSPYGRLVMPW